MSMTYANARLQDVIAGDAGWRIKLRRGIMFVVKALIGAWFCQGMFGALGALNILGSVVVVGWTYRLMQRQALKTWWKNSQPWNEGVRFQTFVSNDPHFHNHLFWPNYFLRQNFLATLKSLPKGRVFFFFKSLLTSLGKNFAIGAKAIFFTWIFTAIPVILLQVAWYQGFDNSFNKGYEQSAIGPVTFLTGIFLFVLVMLYVPMAQARQAVSGNWKSFFHFKAVRQIIRRRWFYCFLLSAGFALLSMPIFTAKAAIYGLGNTAKVAAMTPLEQWQSLNRYLYIVCLFILLPAFVLLRLVAAHIYASAVRDAVKTGESTSLRLSEFEMEALRALEISERPKTERSLPTRFILWSGTMTGRLTTGFLVFFIWFWVAFQPAVQTFFIYSSGLRGYLNHPLVQLPYFHHVPAALKEAAGR
jgi:hypothetical protein